jgi:glycolate oxidase FAD binding subunit
VTHRTIDGLSLPVVRPASAAEVGALVREGQPLYPVGGGTMLHVGLPPTKPGRAVDLTALDQVVDYPARDMTVTVQAGVRVAKLQELLAAEGQRLPIDVPKPDEATVGGSIAANVSGPRRLGAGTLRDYVIGISTVGEGGHETKAGGRVVKNVAGYDLCKLHTGAFGTLGIITQVTLKVRPLPESRALVALGCHDTYLGRLLDLLHASRTRPICVDAINRAALGPLRQAGAHLPDLDWFVIVGFEDNEAAVEWQLQQLIRELTAASFRGVEAFAGDATLPLWRVLADMPLGDGASVTFKANMLAGKVANFCFGARDGAGMHLHAGSGIVWGHLRPGETEERARTMLEKLGQMAVHFGGNLTVPRCPTEWKARLPVWGTPRGDAALMKRVKQKLDPLGLFNPGRFLDGI